MTESRNLPEERYFLLGVIGEGGMGVVERVFDKRILREVARKVIRVKNLSGKQTRYTDAKLERFIAEARLTGKLEHPNIIPIYDMGRLADGAPYYTMKLVQGRTLQEEIDETNEWGDEVELLTLEQKLDIARKICSALAYAHSQEVIHRDLKPSNIMVGGYGEVLVMDWGLARMLDDADPLTMGGHVSGTPSHMSPEQARGGGGPLDVRTDVFGVGAVLYHLFSGNAPYSSDSSQELLHSAREAQLADPDMTRSRFRVPREVKAICKKAMSRDREARYATIDDMVLDLDAFRDKTSGAAWRDGLWARHRKFVQKRPTISVTLFLTLITTIAIGYFALDAARNSTRLTEVAFKKEASALLDWSSELLGGDFVSADLQRNECQAMIDALKRVNIELDESATSRPIAPILVDFQRRDLELHDLASECILQLAFRMEQGDLANAYRYLTEGPNVQTSDARRGVWTRLLELQRPLVNAWPRVRGALDEILIVEWQRNLWQAYEDWRWKKTPIPEAIFDTVPKEASGAEDQFAADIAFLTKRPVKAATLYESAVRKQGGLAGAHMRLGNIYSDRQFGGFSRLRSSQHAWAAYARKPDSFVANMNVGVALSQDNRKRLALEYFERAATIRPSSAKVQANLGQTYMDLSQLDKAQDAIDRALAEQPRDVFVLATLGRLKLIQGKFNEAEEIFRPICDETNLRANDWALYATALLEMNPKKIDDGIRARARACELDTRNAVYRHNYGIALLEDANRLDDALPQFKAATELEPTLWQAWYELAGCYGHGRGNKSQGIDTLRAAVLFNPTACKLFELLAFWLCEAGDYAGAVHSLNTTVDLRKSDLTASKPVFGAGDHKKGLTAVVNSVRGFLKSSSAKLTPDQLQQFEAIQKRATDVRDGIGK